MSKKAALGKGLSALLPQMPAHDPTDEGGEAAAHAEAPRSRLYNFEDRLRLAGRVADVEVDAVRPNPYQPRKDFSEESLDELAASIRQLGIIQPITVRGLGNGRFELISGERRLRAARRAGLKKVPAFIREADNETILEMALVENVQREDLNPIEVALGYQRLIEEVGLTQEDVADKVGKNRTTVTNVLRLLRLPPRIQASLRDGSISAGHARALVSLDEEPAQLHLHRQILDKGLSVRDVERLVREHRERKEGPPRPPREVTVERSRDEGPAVLTPRDRLEIEGMEARLREHLGTRVEIRHKPGDGTGTIEVAYFSLEDLERVVELMAGY
jgi:ParB family chromosome partitioning protein